MPLFSSFIIKSSHKLLLTKFFYRKLSHATNNNVNLFKNIQDLELRQISMTDDSILKYVLENDVVRVKSDINQVKSMINSNGRRLYGLFHPQIELPGSFIHCKLSNEQCKSMTKIQSLIKIKSNISITNCVTMYSVNAPIKGCGLGFHIIKMLKEFLINEEKTKEFYTLSPMPKFVEFILQQDLKLLKLNDNALRILNEELNYNWDVKLKALMLNNNHTNNIDLWYRLEIPLLSIALYYLCSGVDPVANFHTRNGAIIQGIYLDASQEPISIKQSAGILCSYRYDSTNEVSKYPLLAELTNISVDNNFIKSLEQKVID